MDLGHMTREQHISEWEDMHQATTEILKKDKDKHEFLCLDSF